MSTTRISTLFFSIALLASSVAAQSVSMGLPNLVVVDGNGTTLGQVAGFYGSQVDRLPMVAIQVGASTGLFVVDRKGPESRIGYWQGWVLMFSGPDCTGTPYMRDDRAPLEDMAGGAFLAVAGPDADLGTYRLFQATSTVTTPAYIMSYWETGRCRDWPYSPSRMAWPAEEVLPNPLEGFVGPTGTQPSREWRLMGGDTIQTSSP